MGPYSRSLSMFMFVVDVLQHKGDDESKRRTKTNDDLVCIPCFLHLSNAVCPVFSRFL